MPELTNLTDRLAHLRDRKAPATEKIGLEPEHKPTKSPQRKPKAAPRKLPERRFANDYFMIFVYVLLIIAVITQFALIASLDLV
jgi:hypothetical protein